MVLQEQEQERTAAELSKRRQAEEKERMQQEVLLQ